MPSHKLRLQRQIVTGPSVERERPSHPLALILRQLAVIEMQLVDRIHRIVHRIAPRLHGIHAGTQPHRLLGESVGVPDSGKRRELRRQRRVDHTHARLLHRPLPHEEITPAAPGNTHVHRTSSLPASMRPRIHQT